MARLLSFFSFTLLYTLSSCSPTAITALDQLASQQTFTLQEVAVQRQVPWSAEHEILKAYSKYGVEPPAGIQAAVRNFDNSANDGPSTSVEAVSIRNDLEYLIKVRVGNQTLNLDLDTGSADLYVSFVPYSRAF
jgi:hypothetical protein